MAGITNSYGLQIDLSMFLGRNEQATGPWMIAYPQVEEPRQPPLAFRDSKLTICQNVAGLWLKYGAKSLKIAASPPAKFLPGSATICSR
ncbi:hypothetical protein SAMN05444159_5000 [Bradyrhizobium lablabi]|uniref:Uncharacterized protein n=1 Tax=Bradyrhizobium lablabi TaxID=722472 RepID=A0A1M6XX29_9BRAD|nr:hypothetical protein SAMN05444159_5000 [Bradyrhizobium lablabi]